MDPEFEHTLDVEDLCLQMKRTLLVPHTINSEDVVAAVRTTRAFLRDGSLPRNEIYAHLTARAKVYDVYLSLLRHSIDLGFLRSAMENFQTQMMRQDPAVAETLTQLLLLVYFIDREICFCAALE